MPLKIEFNHPEMEKGVGVDLGGFLVENGGSVELTEEQERAFVARHQLVVKDALSGGLFIKISGTSTIPSKELENIIVESNFGVSEEVEEAPATEEVEGSEN